MFMSQSDNDNVKKFLTKLVGLLLEGKKYRQIDDVEIFFVFGSKFKTAMCDWVYGMKIKTKTNFRLRDDLTRDLQMDIRRNFEKFFGQSICATDIVFNRDY